MLIIGRLGENLMGQTVRTQSRLKGKEGLNYWTFDYKNIRIWKKTQRMKLYSNSAPYDVKHQILQFTRFPFITRPICSSIL